MKYSRAIEALTEVISSELWGNSFSATETSLPFDSCASLLSAKSPDIPKASQEAFPHCSGLYFLCSIEDEIYYIGKATKDNLHEEIWEN